VLEYAGCFFPVIDSAPQWVTWAEILAVPLQAARRFSPWYRRAALCYLLGGKKTPCGSIIDIIGTDFLAGNKYVNA
jgi:hypothetical protein